jgi:hypothetical protein
MTVSATSSSPLVDPPHLQLTARGSLLAEAPALASRVFHPTGRSPLHSRTVAPAAWRYNVLKAEESPLFHRCWVPPEREPGSLHDGGAAACMEAACSAPAASSESAFATVPARDQAARLAEHLGNGNPFLSSRGEGYEEQAKGKLSEQEEDPAGTVDVNVDEYVGIHAALSRSFQQLYKMTEEMPGFECDSGGSVFNDGCNYSVSLLASAATSDNPALKRAVREVAALLLASGSAAVAEPAATPPLGISPTASPAPPSPAAGPAGPGAASGERRRDAVNLWSWFRDHDMQQTTHIGWPAESASSFDEVDWQERFGHILKMSKTEFLQNEEAIGEIGLLRYQYSIGFTGRASRVKKKQRYN